MEKWYTGSLITINGSNKNEKTQLSRVILPWPSLDNTNITNDIDSCEYRMKWGVTTVILLIDDDKDMENVDSICKKHNYKHFNIVVT